MAYAQLGKFTTPYSQPTQYYNPNYYGRPFYAILRQTQDSLPDGSYSYRWDCPVKAYVSSRERFRHARGIADALERIKTRSRFGRCNREVNTLGVIVRFFLLLPSRRVFIEEWLISKKEV